MICPYCGKEMEQGSVFNRTRVDWQDNSKSLFPKTVKLSKMGLLGGKAAAYLCENCKKEIIDYSYIEQE